MIRCSGREGRKEKRAAQGWAASSNPKKHTNKWVTSHTAALWSLVFCPLVVLYSLELLSTVQFMGCSRSRSGHKKGKKGQENIFHGLELEVQPAANRSVWAHTTNIQASGHGVCVSHLVIVLHPNREGWRKVPFLEASDCCSCLLVARLPGIDKAAPTSTHTFLLPHFSFLLLWDFPGKTKLHVVLRQSHMVVNTDLW